MSAARSSFCSASARRSRESSAPSSAADLFCWSKSASALALWLRSASALAFCWPSSLSALALSRSASAFCSARECCSREISAPSIDTDLLCWFSSASAFVFCCFSSASSCAALLRSRASSVPSDCAAAWARATAARRASTFLSRSPTWASSSSVLLCSRASSDAALSYAFLRSAASDSAAAPLCAASAVTFRTSASRSAAWACRPAVRFRRSTSSAWRPSDRYLSAESCSPRRRASFLRSCKAASCSTNLLWRAASCVEKCSSKSDSSVARACRRCSPAWKCRATFSDMPSSASKWRASCSFSCRTRAAEAAPSRAASCSSFSSSADLLLSPRARAADARAEQSRRPRAHLVPEGQCCSQWRSCSALACVDLPPQNHLSIVLPSAFSSRTAGEAIELSAQNIAADVRKCRSDGAG
mmetsp:Transcript_87/g.202  ORF Transcript_87/g.202 Transcript_87/m.202 type:complete len:415 (-) Transcript_87:84-1328(-)